MALIRNPDWYRYGCKRTVPWYVRYIQVLLPMSIMAKIKETVTILLQYGTVGTYNLVAIFKTIELRCLTTLGGNGKFLFLREPGA